MYSFSIIILIIILPNHTPFLLIQLFCLLLTIVMAKADLPNFFLVAGPLVFPLSSSSLQTRESCNSTDQSSLGTAHSTRMHCHTYMQRHTVFYWPVPVTHAPQSGVSICNSQLQYRRLLAKHHIKELWVMDGACSGEG